MDLTSQQSSVDRCESGALSVCGKRENPPTPDPDAEEIQRRQPPGFLLQQFVLVLGSQPVAPA
jgi:hypothetical protein